MLDQEVLAPSQCLAYLCAETLRHDAGTASHELAVQPRRADDAHLLVQAQVRAQFDGCGHAAAHIGPARRILFRGTRRPCLNDAANDQFLQFAGRQL
ncbi:hypothetical protein D3C85_1466380 [compost metagenome]